MPNIHEMFPSRFLRAEELQGSYRLVIDRVEEESVNRNGKEEKVWVIYFRNAKKGVVLSRRTALQIASALKSANTEDWIGKEILIYPDEIVMFGRVRQVISFMKPTERRNQHG